MHQIRKNFLISTLMIALILVAADSSAQLTQVGSGSYTNSFPGTDVAGRNSFPSGSPQLSGTAAGKPVPTNDWWSALVKNDHAGNLFSYPLSMRTGNQGLILSYIPWGVFDDQVPIVIGLNGLNASKATVSDHSDWTVTMNWNDGSHDLTATAGIGMPFLYFEKGSSDEIEITVSAGIVSISNEILLIENARYEADFAVYAPTGSTWSQSGSTYSSSLNGKDYWSVAMLPLSASSASVVAQEYKKYAYVFPANTEVSWSYNESTSVVRTNFLVETEIKEGTYTNMLLGLLPHQWASLASDSPVPDKHSYNSVRGEIKTMEGNAFSIENTFKGILPTLPYLANYSEGFSPYEMEKKITLLENDGLSGWTDSYNEGQMMNRLIQTARIADQTGNTEARDKMAATIKERLEDWLTAEASEVAFIFYYNNTWSTLIGYPAGHGQDGNINDHHFHWGYFIHAAAFMEQFEPGWADQWGDMINLLIRDAASDNRNDDKFPFLRNFSPYAGHCWANGFATFPQGNDQESTSESMQFNSSLIHWGSITGNDEIRDLGIYLYTTEQTAIEEYWFDMYERNFSASQQYSLVSRVWGNSYDNGTFWTADIAASYGIEMYPIHGGSLYLGHNQEYVQKLWTEITENTGILNNQENPNLWHDIYWAYLSFIDPQAAIALYDSYPDRGLKFGVTDAQTYHWIHNMNAMGRVYPELTADHPLAAAFIKDEDITYAAHNYSSAPITVKFSDGFELEVPARSMATNKDLDVSSVLVSDFQQAHPNGSVNLSLETSGENITKVEFFEGDTHLGTVQNSPYTWKAANLAPGIHGFFAKIYAGEKLDVSNTVSVTVGEQVAYSGTASAIPGSIQAGHYDIFEGGLGQGITYIDLSPFNEGGFRPTEYVDASADASEGATVGWIAAGEWLEYSIDVENAGEYDLAFRYASGNSNGGGPFHFEIDGKKVSPDISLTYTSDWDAWTDKTVSGIELFEGEQILRLVVTDGEFNLGEMTFSYYGPLGYGPPVANAGSAVVVVLPENSASLDGSQSSDPDGQSLSYLWEQVYGPSVIEFSDNEAVNPMVTNLEEGIYKCKLSVSDGEYSSSSSVLIIVSATANLSPSAIISSPADMSGFYVGSEIEIFATASDLDGEISMVEFFANGIKIGEDTLEPYSFNWTTAGIGSHDLSVKATDNEGTSTLSPLVTVVVESAPSCSGGPDNGDYTYVFSEDKDNPTITFIPGGGNAGSPTCILYYGSSAPFPGYGVTPNTPFQINASEGTKINFYYTYSYNGLERNTMDVMHSYVIGSCSAEQGTITLDISDDSFSLDENSVAGTVVGSPTVAYSGSESLTFSITGGNESEAFAINTENGEISVANQAALDFESTPVFNLDISASDGELTSSATIVINLNNLNETGIDQGIKMEVSVYPNPVKGLLTIDWIDHKRSTLYDLAGRPVKTSHEKVLDMKDLPNGIYILQLEGSFNQRSIHRIVKQ